VETPTLAFPILMTQVEATQRLYSRLNQWGTTDKALALLAERFPGFSPEETLLKVATVNALYGTNVYAIVRMAEHIEAVIRAVGTRVQGTELVECMAALPRTERQQRDRRHYSFASKFAHFFIDPERFPIYDYYAAAMVKYHLGRGGLVHDEGHPYKSFAASFAKLKGLVGFQLTARQLDGYLWLAGQYREWRTGRAKSAINSELRGVFEAHEPEVATDLRVLLGSEGD